MTATVRWVVAIACLLGANVAAMITLALVASFGGSEVIADYYEKGVHYDDALDRAARSQALGWHANATIGNGALEITVRDRHDTPIEGARVHARGYPRAHASQRLDLELLGIGAGRYRILATTPAGVHDLAITVVRAGDSFTEQLAVEAR
jgi:nitrogen fixation protein FixH